jgi:flagellar M-ring protein FliF
MKNFAQSLLDLWKQLGLNQRVSLVVAALAVTGGMIGVVIWSQRPDYTLLFGRLNEKDAASVISYLESQNVPHQVTAGGTAVLVPSTQVYKLRMDLSTKGIPSGDGVGFEIFDKGQFGLSDFVQRTNYMRALQGELARTIIQLQGVRSARVMIVQPENRLLLTEQGVKPTASVFVDIGNSRFEPDQVDSIRHLVANAVQGLDPNQVSVVDNHGRVLSAGLEQDSTLGTASSQIRYRQQIEDYFAKKVESMLSTVIGPGNAVVRVSADIDTESTTLSEEKFDPEGQVIRSQTTTEDSNNTTESRSAGGPVGVAANVPDKAGPTPAAATNRPTSVTEGVRKNHTTNYEINRTTTNIVRNPGTVKSLTAAVFITPRVQAAAPAKKGEPAGEPTVLKRTPEEIAALRQVVINALGLKPAPGQSLDDLVTVQETPFESAAAVPAEVEALQSDGRLQGWIDVARRWSAVAAALAILVVFWRVLSRQKLEPVPVEVLAMTPTDAARSLPNSNSITPELLNELIRQKPANAGVALRDWVAVPAGKN